MADVIRASGPAGDSTGSGEAMGGTLRVGAPLGSQWGVDLEVGRSGDLSWRPDVGILRDLRGGLVRSFGGGLPDDIVIFPPPDTQVQARLLTLTTALSWRHDVHDRFALLYLGGVTFSRTTTETRITQPGRPLPFPIPELVPPRTFTFKNVNHDAGVTIGFEGRVRMSDHLHVVPGLRLMSIRSTLVIRPQVGLQWVF